MCMRLRRLLCFEASPVFKIKPNIVFILADDLGYGDVGFMGQEKIRTPRLDALASEGLVFQNMYAGGPVCGPSRACLFSGMSQDVGYIKGNPGGLPERENFRAEDVLFSELLQAQGYYNVYLGKWGLGPQGASGYPTNKGFDYFVGDDTHVAAFQDLMPTLCELTGATSSASSNGISFVPTLLGEAEQQQAHDYLYWEHIQMMKNSAGVQGLLDVKNNLKGIRFGRAGDLYLFDLGADPSETTNIARAYPEQIEVMQAKLDSMRTASQLWPISMHDRPFREPKN